MLNLPKLIGHRGVKNLAPENTLDSIELAHKLGLKWIEVDVKITKDKIPIVLHDDSLDRTTNFKGLTIDFLYEEIKKCSFIRAFLYILWFYFKSTFWRNCI